jgi:glycosyltransferase involved in cell wall biosynthesis
MIFLMLSLKNKTILLISPQAWGKMFVSKHHYAIELAKYGNKVYFLNPPESINSKESIRIETSALHPNLFIIYHQLSFPYNIKFRIISLFHALMKKHIAHILKEIGEPIDIIWSFDLGNLYPFRFFPVTAYKIFHPVDEPLNKASMASAKGAQIIFSVTSEIVEKYKEYKIPSHIINHGLNETFLKYPVNFLQPNATLHVGFSGNLLRKDIDRNTLLSIIKQNPAIIFECWGSYQLSEANIGGVEDNETVSFIEQLKAHPNVRLHGAVPPERLVMEFQQMDAFLICYDVKKDQSKGTNYHKVMEYLSTGKVIISNNISAYKNRPDLIQMIEDRSSNEALPHLFKEIINSIADHNSISLQEIRRQYAADNSYQKQIEKMEVLL